MTNVTSALPEPADAELIAAGILTVKGTDFAQRLFDNNVRHAEADIRRLAAAEEFVIPEIELILDWVDVYGGLDTTATQADTSLRTDSNRI